MAVDGDEAVSVVRTVMGATDPKKAALGTIRGDLAIEMTENIVHGSDSAASAKRELALFFPDLS
jgi:nucleoside-diphosphate kinase